MVKKMLLIVFTLLFVSSSVVTAEGAARTKTADEVKEKSLSSSSSFIMFSRTKALVTDVYGEDLKMVDLNTSTIAWTKNYDRVIDVKIMHNPEKIILLVEEKQVLMKVTLNEAGVEQARRIFPAIKTRAKDGSYLYLKWIAPAGRQGEQILVQDHEKIEFYQYPWKKSVRSINLSTTPSTRYEYITVVDYDYVAPYLVVKYSGQGIMQTQHFYQVTNVLTKQYFTRFFETYLDTDFSVQSGTLHITTYGQLGGPLFIDEQSPHVVAVQYDLKTGKTINQIMRRFEPSAEQGWYGWRAEYGENTLLIEDRGKREWRLYDQSYTPLIAEQTSLHEEDMNYPFIFYNKEDAVVYFFDNGEVIQIPVP